MGRENELCRSDLRISARCLRGHLRRINRYDLESSEHLDVNQYPLSIALMSVIMVTDSVVADLRQIS